MVTSAVFGAINLLMPDDQRRALALLLGMKCFEKAGFDPNLDISIELWQRYDIAGPSKYVEPDVVLCCGARKVIVEVKWHASLPKDQLEKQIDAVGEGVGALVMLGDADAEGKIGSVECFRRTWREVSSDFHKEALGERSDTPLMRWVLAISGFLQQTDKGHIFAGLPEVGLVDPGAVFYRFQSAGSPPWHTRPLGEVCE